MPRLTTNVFLVGIMGVGKTSVARRLARMLGVSAIDVDSYIRNMYRRDSACLFKDVGEEKFRECELSALRSCAKLGPAIISCSEGAVCTPEGRRLLSEEGFAVFLDSSCAGALKRIKSLRTRPLLAQGCDAHELMEQRRPQLERVARVCVDVEGKATGDAAACVVRILKDEGIYEE